jgi:hypothetical protein
MDQELPSARIFYAVLTFLGLAALFSGSAALALTVSAPEQAAGRFDDMAGNFFTAFLMCLTAVASLISGRALR